MNIRGKNGVKRLVASSINANVDLGYNGGTGQDIWEYKTTSGDFNGSIINCRDVSNGTTGGGRALTPRDVAAITGVTS